MATREKHLLPQALAGQVIDIHAHVGISIKAYAATEFPYCQSVEGLIYRQRENGVQASVVFPFSADLYFDLPTLINAGRCEPAAAPLSPAPYEQENRMLMTEVFDFCPEHSSTLLPFVSVDPLHDVPGQLAALSLLEQNYSIYGIKISPVACQAPVTCLLSEGAPLLDFAAARDLPLLFHVTTHPEERFSQLADTFEVVERHPELRFCLAHCLGFSLEFLGRAAAAPHVWVDTAALKIQTQLANENSPITALPADRPDLDYSDHTRVLQQLVNRYPKTIIWGSDSPYYSFISRRMQAPGQYSEFRLKATYEDEKAALDALSGKAYWQVCNANSRRFLFGTRPCHKEDIRTPVE